MSAIKAGLAERGVEAAATYDLTALGPDALGRIKVLVSVAYPCAATEMNALPALRGIVSPALGYEWIDVDEASRRGIAVVNGEVAENRESMAEATVLMLLALLYRLPDTEASLRHGGDPLTTGRRMLKGLTVGIIGHGGIARGVINRLAAWGCHFLIHSRSQGGAANGEFVALERLLRESDVVVVLTSLDAETRHLLDRERLAEMKPGALLVNTARGGIIDEAALVDALRSGAIGGAALDVFEVEPLGPDSPLRELPRVILTGHCIGHTESSASAISRKAVANALTLLEGDLPESCRNREALLEAPASE